MTANQRTTPSMDTIDYVAPLMRPFIALEGLTGAFYTYEKKPWAGYRIPQVRHRIASGMGKIKAGDEALYILSDSQRGPADPSARLMYVGCANGDRMFRGNPEDASNSLNFHHGNIRGGPLDTRLQDWLRSRGPLYLHRVNGKELLAHAPAGSRWSAIASLAISSRHHKGYYFEQAILLECRSRFPWNSDGVGEPALSGLLRLGFRPEAMTKA